LLRTSELGNAKLCFSNIKDVIRRFSLPILIASTNEKPFMKNRPSAYLEIIRFKKWHLQRYTKNIS
jgi:hypothetical protein